MPHVRTIGDWVVMVLTDLYHKHGVNQGRPCEVCGERWTALRENGQFRVWKGDQERTSQDVLDFVGNNVAVKCCIPLKRHEE